MTANSSARYRLDDLRRLAGGMLARLGVAPSRASALASHLLWFDAAGASSHGIATLPDWLGRIEAKQVDPIAEGRAALERTGTAVFDARNGLAPLALEAAAGVAAEKARDVGVGMVRVRNVGATGPAAPIAAGLAIGPFVALIAGPSPSLTVAMPSPDGLPVLYDSGLVGLTGGAPEPPEGWLGVLAPWITTLSGGDGWVILAISVASMESLSTFHERVAGTRRGDPSPPGQLWPEGLEDRRRVAREQGVALGQAATVELRAWAERLGVDWPSAAEG